MKELMSPTSRYTYSYAKPQVAVSSTATLWLFPSSASTWSLDSLDSDASGVRASRSTEASSSVLASSGRGLRRFSGESGGESGPGGWTEGFSTRRH